jgi:hypothetical protein
VGRAVEIFRLEDLDDFEEGGIIDQNGADQRFFGFEILRRKMLKGGVVSRRCFVVFRHDRGRL